MTEASEGPVPTTIGGRVVVGTDGSEGGDRALKWAAGEARRSEAVLHIVVAWSISMSAGFSFTVEMDEVQRASDDTLERSISWVRKNEPDVEVRGEVSQDAPALALVDASAGADLLVVGSRGLGGFRGLLLGSVSQHCAHHAHCPVAIIRPPS